MAKLQLQTNQISINKEDTFQLKVVIIFELLSLDTPYIRSHTIFELTCLLFDQELTQIVHKFGVHPVHTLPFIAIEQYVWLLNNPKSIYFHLLQSSMSESKIFVCNFLVDEPKLLPFLVSVIFMPSFGTYLYILKVLPLRCSKTVLVKS